MSEELIEALIQLGLTPLDWMDASMFSKLTGIKDTRLNDRRKKWPEDLVWTKQDGVIQYSLIGYNKWLTEKAQSRYRKGLGSEMDQSKSILNDTAKSTTLPSRTPRLVKVSAQPRKLELH